MAISSIRKNLRLAMVILGVGLLCTYLYTKTVYKASTISISKRQNLNIIKKEAFPPNVSEGECRWMKPWYIRPVSRYKHTQMIFFAKPYMQSLKTIAMNRHWKTVLITNDSTIGLAKLHNYLTSPDTFTIVVTSSRLYKHSTVQRLSQMKTALVSAIRYSFKITGGKRGQLIAFREHFSKYGCSFNNMEIMPRSFLLDDVKECLQFFKYANQNPNSWWVLKESANYGGMGITIHSNLTILYKHFRVCTNTKEYVVQKYLRDPLLINKRKFDIRGLVLITSTRPYLLFHHNGYLRVSMKDYTTDGGREAHITNSHLQVNAHNYSPNEHLWSFERFQNYLDNYLPGNGDFVNTHLVPFIKNTALFILQTGRTVFADNPSSYQLLGLDFMVTSDLRLWFIEANNYPLWPTGSEYIDDFMHSMGNDMFDLLFEVRENPLMFIFMKPGSKYKSWELVWNELDEQCSNRSLYNPCAIFNSTGRN